MDRLTNALSPIPAVTRANAKTASAKYRPVLTALQIEHILYLAKSERPMAALSLSLISTLAPFQAKIQNAGINAAYSTSPKMGLMESLGVEAGAETAPAISSDYNNSAIIPTSASYNKQAYWKHCYNKFKADPVSCSLREIEASQEHAYLNELMSPEEIAAFENLGEL
jgi:hypothetical protein